MEISDQIINISKSLDSYLGNQEKVKGEMANEAFKSQLDLSNKKAEEVYKHAWDGKVTPEQAGEQYPDLAQQAQSFKEANGRYATPDEAKTMGWFQQADDAKQSKQQDALEKQFQDRMTQVRGDQSISRTELQRDAAGMAYDTIAKAKSENRDLTQLEQGDLIGQLAKARFGKFTDEDRKAMEEMTAKRGFNHVITYLTGDPKLIGASTPETLGNLEQFIDATGQKADQQHEAYMANRRNPPSGLAPERVAHVLQTTRGISYNDQKEVSNKTYAQKKSGGDVEAKKAALRAKLGL